MSGITQSQSALSIVLPCYNPVMGWAETVVQTTQLIQQKLNAQVDLIIVMDG